MAASTPATSNLRLVVIAVVAVVAAIGIGLTLTSSSEGPMAVPALDGPAQAACGHLRGILADGSAGNLSASGLATQLQQVDEQAATSATPRVALAAHRALDAATGTGDLMSAMQELTDACTALGG